MKYKLPTLYYLHPDSGREMRYDPETKLFDTADPSDRVLYINQIKPRIRSAVLAELKRWCREQSYLLRVRESVKSGGSGSAAIAPHC